MTCPLAEAVRRARDAQAGSMITVTSSGVPVGIVSEAALDATPEERRPWVATSAVARSLDDGLRLPAAIAGEDLVTAISRHPAVEYLLVEEDGSVFGVLTTADVDRAFRGARTGVPGCPTPPKQVQQQAPHRSAPDVPPEAWSGVHRGPLRAGEWVRLMDSKGRRHNICLEPGKTFHTNRGGMSPRRPDRS